MKTLCLFLMLASASTLAFGGTRSCNTNTTWKGLPREYDLYVPTYNGTSPTVLWVMLHPTSSNPGGCGTNQSDFDQSAMESLADQNNFIVLWPIATQNPLSSGTACSTYIWESYALSYIWTTTTNPSCQPGNSHVDPDDSGFIRSLINSMRTNNGITTVYVAGMSSGAFMAHRVGLDSTLHDTIPVQAVGAASGQIYAVKHGGTFTMHQPSSQFVAVVMLNGDQDTTVPYCGQQNGTGWGNSDFPKSDVSLDYWANANNPNGCNPALPQLCINGQVNTQVTTYSCGNVTFSREVNNPHCWVTGTESRMWTFFTTGIWPATSLACPNILSFSPLSGAVGTDVTVTGGGFTGTTKVTFNGISATFTVNSDSQVTATVPTGATTGPIAITTPGGTFSSNTNFKVTP